MDRALLGIVLVGAHRELAARERDDVVRDRGSSRGSRVASITTRSCRHSRSTNAAAPAPSSAIVRSPSIARKISSWRPIGEQHEVGVGVGPVDQRRGGTGRKALLDGDRGRHRHRHPAIGGRVGEVERARRRVVGVEGDRRVTGHRAAEQLHEGVLLDGGECGDPGGVRRLADRAAVRQIRRLALPAAEPQAGAADELEQLGHGVGTVARVAQRVGERVVVGEVARLAQQPAQRMRRAGSRATSPPGRPSSPADVPTPSRRQ